MEIALLIIAVVAIALIVIISNKNTKAKIAKEEESYKSQYGNITKKIEDFNPSTMKVQNIYIFENSRIIMINGVAYSFNDILDFSINDGQSYKVSTSTGSVLGRGLIGGMALGGVGAVIGASTAKETIDKSKEIKIHITTKKLSNPMIEYHSVQESKVYELISVLKIIIDGANNL